MKIILAIFLLISSFSFPENPAHGFYLGLVEIDAKNTTEPAKITIRVFTDDMEDCLRNASEDFKKGAENEFCENHYGAIQAYFSNHFYLKINGQKQQLNFQSCQKENEIYWLKFEINALEKWSSVEIFADFFMELFPDQSNVVSIFYGKESGHCRLVGGHEKASLSF